MPIRRIQSRRKGCKPFAFFKGTIDEIVNASPAQLAVSLEKSGAALSKGADPVERLKQAREIRERLLRQLEEGCKVGWMKTADGGIPLRIKRLKNGRILLHQCPAQHGVGARGGRDPFQNLKKILEEGFRSLTGDVNVFVREQRGGGVISHSKQQQTFGDWYSIELMAPLDYFPHVKSATPKQILSVHVGLNKELTEEQRSGRKKFYRKEITEAFGVPVHFHISAT